jgi:hypothetical protein
MIKCNRQLTMLLLFTAALMFAACENSGEKTSESQKTLDGKSTDSKTRDSVFGSLKPVLTAVNISMTRRL